MKSHFSFSKNTFIIIINLLTKSQKSSPQKQSTFMQVKQKSAPQMHSTQLVSSSLQIKTSQYGHLLIV